MSETTSTEQLEANKVVSLKDRIDAEAKTFEKDVFGAKLTQLEGQLTAVVHNAEARMQGFDKSMQSVVDQVNSQAMKLQHQIMALEQSVLSFGKMLTALTSTLVQKGTIIDSEVLEALRSNEDKMSEDRIDELVKLNLIELTQTSDAESVIILKQEQVMEDGSRKLVSNYRSFELPNLPDTNSMKKELIGKVAGDVIGLVDTTGNFSFTVKAVYKLKEQGSESEDSKPSQGA